MAGADMILNKILDDAKSDAATILNDANERANVLKARSQAAVATSGAQAMASAQKEAIQRKERRLRMATLDARKEQLSMKRELIELAIEQAQVKLKTMDDQSKRALFMSMLLSSAQGGETILPSAKDAGLFTPDVLVVMNSELALMGKSPVTLGAVAPHAEDGFLLMLGGMQCNCSVAALLRQECDALEPMVAHILFPTKEG